MRKPEYSRYLMTAVSIAYLISAFISSCVLATVQRRPAVQPPFAVLVTLQTVWSLYQRTNTNTLYAHTAFAWKQSAVNEAGNRMSSSAEFIDNDCHDNQSPHRNNSKPRVMYLASKRFFDIVCSILGMIFASPLMVATAIAIKICDGGPVFYRQTRLTKDGRLFTMLKFRSMRVDAESDGIARLASVNDCRITPIGRIIRAHRIDELPQLYNILVGDMTLVGPRPERPEIAAEYEKEIPEFSLRLQVKAGLTGLAQVYGSYNTDPSTKLKLDLTYINNMSFAEDMRIILMTPKVLFMKDRTSGIHANMTNALGINSSFDDTHSR